MNVSKHVNHLGM